MPGPAVALQRLQHLIGENLYEKDRLPCAISSHGKRALHDCFLEGLMCITVFNPYFSSCAAAVILVLDHAMEYVCMAV